MVLGGLVTTGPPDHRPKGNAKSGIKPIIKEHHILGQGQVGSGAGGQAQANIHSPNLVTHL